MVFNEIFRLGRPQQRRRQGLCDGRASFAERGVIFQANALWWDDVWCIAFDYFLYISLIYGVSDAHHCTLAQHIAHVHSHIDFRLEIIFVTFARCSPFGRLFFWRIGLKRKKESFISGLAPLPTGQFVLFYVSFCCCCCWCAVPSFSDTRMCARKRLLWNGTHHIASQSGYYYMYCIHWIQFSRRNSNYNSCSLCAPRCVRACVAGIKCM